MPGSRSETHLKRAIRDGPARDASECALRKARRTWWRKAMSNQGPTASATRTTGADLPRHAGRPAPTDVEESTDDAVTFIERSRPTPPSVAAGRRAILEGDLGCTSPEVGRVIRRTIGHVQAVDGSPSAAGRWLSRPGR